MKKALVIDPDAEFRRQIYRWLLTSGWRVIEADEGELGLSMTLQEQPDLVICDLLIPRLNGFKLFRSIRGQRTKIRQPILIATGSSSYASDRKNALDAGADRYLVKPFQQADLLALLEGNKLFETEHVAPAASLQTARAFAPLVPEDQPPVVRFWGVRGSIPTPGPGTVMYGGNTSCVEVRADGEIIILDAGSGIRGLGLALAREFKDRPISVTILVTHTHWDHIQGFPFFVPAYNPANKVRIFGYEGARKGLLGTLSAQMESPYFPVSLQEMTSNIDVKELKELEFSIGRVRVCATFANHPGICLGYRLYTSGGSIAFFPDHEPHQRMRSQAAGPEGDQRVEALRHASQQDQKLIDFLEGTDLLIIDAQYDDSEYQQRVGWGHGCVDDVVALAMFARVRQLMLFHHDPDHDDSQVSTMLGWARELTTMHGDPLRVDAAREGQEIVLRRPPSAPPAAPAEAAQDAPSTT